MMVACVGIVGLDGVDAEEPAGTPTAPFKVSYQVGEMTYQRSADSANLVKLMAPEELGAQIPAGRSFGGWESATGTVYTAGSEITLTADTVLTAKLNDILYTVKFTADGAEVLVLASQPYGTVVTAPAAPVKAGFVFGGWADSTGQVVETIPAVSADAVYTATFLVDHRVSFIVDGTTIYSATVSTMVVPASPEKVGHEFQGWAVGGSVVDIGEYEIAEDTVFTAEFRADVHTVTFVAGETVLATQTVEYGKLAMEPVVDMPAGYKGWDFDFATPVTGDLTIGAREYTAPEQGLDNDYVKAGLVCLVFVVLALLAAFIWAKQNGKLPFEVVKRGKE